MKTFINLLRDDSGASAAEYALILAIIGGAHRACRDRPWCAVSGSMNRAATCVQRQHLVRC